MKALLYALTEELLHDLTQLLHTPNGLLDTQAATLTETARRQEGASY